jgi:hypothetical protein
MLINNAFSVKGSPTQPKPRPIVLGILQNQWFYDSARIRAMIQSANEPERMRRKLVDFYLFRGCKTGRMLRHCFGDSWCDRILWENASKEIGDFSSDVFPADLDHLARRIIDEAPDVVIGFGKIACGALDMLVNDFPRIYYLRAPHPASRQVDIYRALHRARKDLDGIQTNHFQVYDPTAKRAM